MIRQVSYLKWLSLLDSLTPEEKNAKIQALKSFQDHFAERGPAIVKQYKDALGMAYQTDPDYIAARTQYHADMDAQGLALGWYETITEEQLGQEHITNVVEFAKKRPDVVLQIVTAITNHYRVLNEKPGLTENEVRVRLLK